MTRRRDVEGDVDGSPLDHWTAERLLAGAVDPDQAPPGWGEVAALVRAARAPAEPAELAGEAATVASMRRALAGVPDRRRPSRRHLPRLRTVAVVAAALVFATAGLAFAGALPGPAQGVASSVLSRLGISVPNQHRHPDLPAPSGTGRGPEVPGPAATGLCTASRSGQGGVRGNKDQAVPFQNLAASGIACPEATPGTRSHGPKTAGAGGRGLSHRPKSPRPTPQAPAPETTGTGSHASPAPAPTPSPHGRSASGRSLGHGSP